jgi:hypothetical protein
MLLSECFWQLKRYKEDWLRDDLSLFGDVTERIGVESFLTGITYARAYFLLNGRRIRKRDKELIKKRVLKNRKLIYSMAYWLKLLTEENIKGKLREEATVRFWVNMPYAVSHWFIAWKAVKENKTYYLGKSLKELQIKADPHVVRLAQKTISILKARMEKKISPDAGPRGNKVFLRSRTQNKYSGVSNTGNDKKRNS